DRMSINLELPTEAGLKMVAPEKNHDSVRKPLAYVRDKLSQYKAERSIIKHTPTFVPAGQSTQMVIGATPESDFQIMSIADDFYKNYELKRVYYSAYIPIPGANNLLLQLCTAPPLIRANRLYQPV